MNARTPQPPDRGSHHSKSPITQQIEEAEGLRRCGNADKALLLLDRLVQAHPSNVRALNEKGVCLRLLGQPVKAAMELRKARKLAPNSPELLANLGDCLRDEGDLERAVRAYTKALELRPDFAPVHCELAATWQALGRPKKAVAAYGKALALKPLQPGPLANFGSASLEVGEPERALELASRSLSLDPRSRRAMSVKGFALHELGRDEEAAELFNLELIRPFPFESIDGFNTPGDFNRALSAHVTHHPSLEYEPANRSTTKGEQTGDLTREPKGPVEQLERMINASVRTFLDELPQDPKHPFLSHRPERWKLNIWGTRLGSQGHQASHIHPSAWVSGVFYAQLPPEVSDTRDNQDGWIEFGAAPAGCTFGRERPLRLIAPRESTLVLFPSYFYHRTLPFESEIKRISIAFDAIPDD